MAGTVAAKVRHLFGLCKDCGRNVWKGRRFLTDVGCGGVMGTRGMGTGTLVHSLGSMNLSPMISQQLLAGSDPALHNDGPADNNEGMW